MSTKNQVFLNPYTQAPLVWHAQGAYISWGYSASDAAAGLRDQNKSNGFAALNGILIRYSRGIATMYPIGGQAPLQVVGAPSGTCSLSNLLGPLTSLSNFIKAAGDACNPIYICIQPFALSLSHCNTKANNQLIITLVGCVSESLGVAISQGGQGSPSMVNVPISLRFTDMLWQQ